MTREERQQKIEQAFPYEPMSSEKEDITRCLDGEGKQGKWVEWLAVVFVLAVIAAYVYKNYYQ